MSKIAAAFKKQRKCFIPFITAGDPNLDVTEQLIVAMANAGADIVELGIPFSDPVAEGEVIQAANIRALSAGTTIFNLYQPHFYLWHGKISGKLPKRWAGRNYCAGRAL